MKRFFIGLVVAFMACSAYAKDIEVLVVTTNPPMSCQNCENKIKGNLRFEKGIKNITTNLSEQRVVIKYDADKTTPQNIEEAFKKIGYQVDVIESDGNEDKDSAEKGAIPSCCKSTTGVCSAESPGSCGTVKPEGYGTQTPETCCKNKITK